MLLVSQETHLFDQSLRDNITLVRPDATDDQLEQVAQQLGIDWFHALPNGLDTTDLHHRLTPVQAQQLALARVALADADLLLLDEATADADSRAARDLESAMTQAIGTRSALVIAHRLGQAKRANQVVVMANGQIVESGHHNDLIQTGGPYDMMWSAWMRARTSDD